MYLFLFFFVVRKLLYLTFLALSIDLNPSLAVVLLSVVLQMNSLKKKEEECESGGLASP